MNLASWVILLIVIAIAGLAARSAWKKRGCACGCGDSAGCSGCAGCAASAAAADKASEKATDASQAAQAGGCPYCNAAAQGK